MSGPGNSGLPGMKVNDPENGPNAGTPFKPTTVPTTVTAPTSTYTPYSPYSTPTFAYTPYSQYSGLAQQLAAAMNPKIQPYAAPRTDITDMAYAPWSMIYGGPSGTPFPGSLPPPPPTGGPTTPPVPTGGPVADRPTTTTPPPPPGTSAPPTPGGNATKDLPPGAYNPMMASVNNTRAQYAGLPPQMTPQQMALPGRQGVRNWLAQVDPQRLADQFGYVAGAHGVTPDSFKGTNAYKGK